MCHFNNISCMDISRLNNNNMRNNMFMPSQRICRLLLLVDKPTYRPLNLIGTFYNLNSTKLIKHKSSHSE